MKRVFAVIIGVALALTAQANTIVFNTLGPGDTYNQISALALQGSNPGPLVEPAAQFTALASGNLATLDLGVTYTTLAGATPFNAFLYGDAGGIPDNGNQILLGSGTPTAALGTTNNSLVNITIGGIVPVTLGNIYWLVLKPASANTSEGWNGSSPLIPGTTAFSTDDSSWTGFTDGLPAFRLTVASNGNGTAVPDRGGTFPLLIASFAGLVLFRRARPRISAV